MNADGALRPIEEDAALAVLLRGGDAEAGGRSTTVIDRCRFASELSWAGVIEDVCGGAGLEASFSGCEFDSATLAGANLEGTRFDDCDFCAVSFRSAELRDCSFTNCRFFVNDEICDFRYAELRDARFAGCDLTTARFERANAHGLVLERCQAQGADFSQMDCGLQLSRNNLLTQFTAFGCNLAYANFSSTHLPGAELRECRLAHAVFDRCVLSDANLTESDLSNVEAQQVQLAGADLRGAQFNTLDPRQVDLTGTVVSADQALVLLTTMGIEVDTRA